MYIVTLGQRIFGKKDGEKRWAFYVGERSRLYLIQSAIVLSLHLVQKYIEEYRIETTAKFHHIYFSVKY